MTTWYTGDTHFGHGNIIRFCDRPFGNINEMNRRMTELWNERVKPDDLVIHVGDWGSPRCKDPRPYLQNLNGKIILIKGNHDKMKMLRYFPMWTEKIEAIIGGYKCLIIHRPWYPKDMRGQNDKYNDHNSHIQDINRYDFVISGHIHEKRKWSGKSINVGVDMWDYAPIDEELLISELDQKHFGKE